MSIGCHFLLIRILKNPRLIANAKGVYLKTHEGHTLIDGSSGLYCNPLGHGRREIIDAIKNQLRKIRLHNAFSTRIWWVF